MAMAMATPVRLAPLFFPANIRYQTPPPPRRHVRLFCSGPTIPITTTPNSGLIFPLDPTGSGSVGSPVIHRFSSYPSGPHQYLMWYHASSSSSSDTTDHVGIAVSNNGIHWDPEGGEVMGPSTDWWAFDTASVRPSSVLVMSNSKLRAPTSSVYWLYYTGFDADDNSLPGLAISQDGRHWARIEGAHHSGALFEDVPPYAASPKVVYHKDGDLRMYYHSFDEMRERFCVFASRSRDGINWVKLGTVFDGGNAGKFEEGGVRNGHVVRDPVGKRYLMAYERVSFSGRMSIGLAESVDGLKDWRPCSEAPVLVPGEEVDAWDGQGVGSPCLLHLDGEDVWRMYYVGVGRDGRTGIGMAISEGPELQKFKKWSGIPT